MSWIILGCWDQSRDLTWKILPQQSVKRSSNLQSSRTISELCNPMETNDQFLCSLPIYMGLYNLSPKHTFLTFMSVSMFRTPTCACFGIRVKPFNPWFDIQRSVIQGAFVLVDALLKPFSSAQNFINRSCVQGTHHWPCCRIRRRKDRFQPLYFLMLQDLLSPKHMTYLQTLVKICYRIFVDHTHFIQLNLSAGCFHTFTCCSSRYVSSFGNTF